MTWIRRQEWPWWQAGAGMAVSVVAPQHVAGNAYWQTVRPLVDWQFMGARAHQGSRCSDHESVTTPDRMEEV
jgi:hypothetical protein